MPFRKHIRSGQIKRKVNNDAFFGKNIIRRVRKQGFKTVSSISNKVKKLHKLPVLVSSTLKRSGSIFISRNRLSDFIKSSIFNKRNKRIRSKRHSLSNSKILLKGSLYNVPSKKRIMSSKGVKIKSISQGYRKKRLKKSGG